MLKIKDNVDLKELEKFGLKRRTCFTDNNKNEYFKRGYTLNEININKDNSSKIILTSNEFMIDDLLYDLIKADLVEKVGDDK